jgi:hypothetical protein
MQFRLLILQSRVLIHQLKKRKNQASLENSRATRIQKTLSFSQTQFQRKFNNHFSQDINNYLSQSCANFNDLFYGFSNSDNYVEPIIEDKVNVMVIYLKFF